MLKAARAVGAKPGLDEGSLAGLIGWQVSLASVATRQAFAAHVGEPFALKPVEFSLLTLLAFNPGVTQKQLAQVLAMSAPNTTILIDRLAERGLLERVRSVADRRSQNVHLTAAGQSLTDRARAAAIPMEAEVTMRLSEGERAMLLELLRKVAAARK